jgi:acyl-coenzyme A thioesterase PaaI-like protein
MTEAGERALRSIALTRARGLNFYGHFIGLNGGVPADGKAALRLAAGETSSAAVAVLVDMAMGSAVRSLVAPGILLSTVTLTLHHVARAFGQLEARCNALPVEDGHGLVQCVLVDLESDTPVGHAQAWFAVASASAEGTPPGLMPWEYLSPPPVPSVDASELDAREQAMLRATEAAHADASLSDASLSDALVQLTWSVGTAGAAGGVLAASPHLENRMGQIQGGILFGAARLAAERALGLGGAARLMDGQYHFLRPCVGDATVDAQTSRKGRGVATARVTVCSGDVLVGTGQFAFRPPAVT